MAVPNVALIASSEGPVSGDLFDDRKAFSKSLTSEIVIALCGPMGTPLHEVAQTFQKLLLSNDFGYEEVVILRLSDEIRRIKGLQDEKSIEKLIEAGNELRQEHGNAVLARLAIQDILLSRTKHQDEADNKLRADNPEADPSLTMPRAPRRCCHIIDSVKHIDELQLLRSVYGDMLHVVGVYSPIDMRIERLEKRKGPDDQIHRLIDRDSGEEVDYGQSVEETFPLSDFFLRVDSATDSQRNTRVRRFLELMLGTNIITPTINERAMYAAFSAARNSACLSRQVGAAITNEEGEILATGWNDVPRAFGGLYQTVDQNSSRDDDRRCWNMDGGHCYNDEEKTLIANAMVDRLIENGLVAEDSRSKAFTMIRKDSQLKSLIEFSRAVHAEMHALLTAGETKGSQIRRGKLFVTTYPCHSCARHLVAAGIKEVFFLEPYRKSLATKLHSDSITERESDEAKVRLMPFDGVAPSRFLKFFSSHPSGRKDGNGKMHVREASPVTSITLEAIHTLEAFALRALQSRGLNK
ncbi:anti-phage dCTP deaminase [Pseudomonas rhodesiae]|jgi:deoxycytidylate deaminase/dephospho-CoA kinase|uniref:anti-phage dCTP deaminase n=1 Tax=Pseudomonas rhodesiae TaxID=76760 RepID=UPI0026494F6A|nr:anti-phage dCTP deaminase [Pseudomonas rhodesiae]MDN6864800.1 anti-phage dCTP deaminase [Pseudomonas rhodesiae]